MSTVRILLSLASNYNWDLQQFNAKNALLHGNLEEEIYMEVPLQFRSDLDNEKMCKLKKAQYKLKQSPRAWFGRFAKVMKNVRYRQNQGNYMLFIKHSNLGEYDFSGICR